MTKYTPILLFLTLTIMILNACKDGEGKTAEDIFEKYEGQEGVFIFRLPPALIGIFIDGDENPDLKQSLRKMEMIKVMIYDDGSLGQNKKEDILREFNEKLRESQFQDLLLASEGEQVIRIKFREDENEIIQEMMILITEEDTFFGLSMVGEINLDQLTDVAKSLDIKDFQDIGE